MELKRCFSGMFFDVRSVCSWQYGRRGIRSLGNARGLINKKLNCY